MPSSTPSSISRYRPAILILTGAAAAYAAWLLYSSVRTPPPDGLHRSNAVRRPHRNRGRNTRTHLARHLLSESYSLGTFDFFGHPVNLDTRDIITPAALREIAHQVQPDARPEVVEARITQFYDHFLDRLLGFSFPGAPLSAPETEAIARMIGDQIPEQEHLSRAVQRHGRRYPVEEAEAAPAADGADSIAPTDLSWRSDEDTEGGIDPDGQTLQRTLYHIAEDRARHEGVIHRGITCNGCDTKPIRGIRWRCANCPDFDLCSDCEATNSHTKTHIFYKIRVPAPYLGIPKQDPVYPGRPHAMSPSINSAIKKRLVAQTRMEAEEIEALWDQFTCLAATEWDSDPSGIGWALDRRSFNHAFTPRYSSFISAPNLIYDRVFSYFDTDQNALIGFDEFIKGLDGMHSPDARVKLRIAFNGYDIDGDGFVSRKDVLRIFRAHYAIEREATRNYLAETTEELSVRGALDTIHSAQPLGSAFTQNIIPRGNRNGEHMHGKPSDDDISQFPILEDSTDAANREAIIRATYPRNGSHIRNEAEAVRDRWARRQYYTDEEEGLTRPDGVQDDAFRHEPQEQPEDEAEPPTSDHERPRGSRSSSRVRFQDDIDVETRSNASTSSRPIGERWGGYEIPEPEKDLGKDILYQITQQGFNELLDPLFKDKEDDAMDAFATRSERRVHAEQIDGLLEEFEHEHDINGCVLAIGAFGYANRVVKYFCNGDITKVSRIAGVTPSGQTRKELREEAESLIAMAEEHIVRTEPSPGGKWEFNPADMWTAKLYRIQLKHELTNVVDTLATRQGWIPPPPSPPKAPNQREDKPSKETTYRDPTLPQFRPNSLADLEGDTHAQIASEHRETCSHCGHVVPENVEQPFAPVFVIAAEISTEDAPSSADPELNDKPTHQYTTPGQDLSHYHFLPAHEGVPEDDESCIHFLYIDADTQILRAESHPVENHIYHEGPPAASFRDKFARRFRREALDTVDSPLHLPYLACLESVDREIRDRKGSGRLNFDEFEKCVQDWGLRFLESWVDWVSF